MADQLPFANLRGKVAVNIAVSTKDPSLCWYDRGPHGSDSACRFLEYHRRRKGIGFVQWCKLTTDNLERIDDPVHPSGVSFKRCQKCLDTFGPKPSKGGKKGD